MAAYRNLGRRLALVSITVALVLAVVPAAPAVAYDNISAHPEINSRAVLRFLERAKDDEWLSSTSLDGRKALGLAVAEIGNLSIREEAREMSVAEWLAHGGMSADEPELPASFRHFFDPLRNSGVAYLTDHIDDLLEFGAGLGQTAVSGAGWFVTLPDTTNPQVDARAWALDHPDNPWTYAKAVEYYTAALAKQQRLSEGDRGLPIGTNPEYGKAWRAVGETMHLMADMTVPAHVRNDSHPYVPVLNSKLGNPDPYESTIRAAEIADYADYAPAGSIDYTIEDLNTLFEVVARWTNRSFFSLDTVPIEGRATTHNGQPPYPSPGLGSWLVASPDASTYFFGEVEGESVPLIRRSMLVKLGMIKRSGLSMLKDMVWPPQIYSMDLVVLDAQRSFLIPTAIEASSRVIDAFLPRLKVEFTAEQIAADKLMITGRLLHEPTLTWPNAPKINNGAFLEYVPAGFNDVHIVWLPDVAFQDGNRIEYELEAEPGALVSLNWDLGGYLVKTERRVVRGIDLKVLPERLGDVRDGDEVFLEAVLSDIPKLMPRIGLEWSFGDGTDPVATSLPAGTGDASDEMSHIYEKPGDYTLRVRATHPDSGEVLAEVTRTIKVQSEQITVQIYPRALSGQPGATLEASALPSNDKFRYEWTFGDGKSSATDGGSVVQHAWASKGTYELVLKLYRAGAGAGATPLAQDKIQVTIGDDAGTGTGGTGGGTGSADPGKVYVWRLVQIVHLDNKGGWELQDAGARPWHFDWAYGTGSFYSRVWLKDDKNYVAYGAKATWGQPPAVIRAGDELFLPVSLAETENTHKWNSTGAATWAKFCNPALGLGSRGWDDVEFKNAAGSPDVTINGAGPSSVSETLSAIAPAGKVGARIAVRVWFYHGSNMGTDYVYEWQPL